MMNLRILFIGLAGLTAAYAGGGPVQAAQSTPPDDARARAVVAQMTLDEKILEMHGVGGASPNIRIVPAIPRLGIPAFVITNGPDGATNGTVKPVPPATAMPDTLLLSATFDRSLATTYGTVIGAEARTLGNDLLEGPDMNLARVPSGGRTFENVGEDPYLAGQIAASDIQGIQSQGEIGEAKHYLGNEQETNRFSLNDVIDERTMRELYLVPFETSVKQGQAGAVMCAYPKINGTASCENALIQNTILKGEWGFNGLITSDFGAVHSTVASANNGLDLEMPSGKFFGSALQAAVTSGAVSMATLDDHLVRRFRTTMALGLWDAPPVAHPISATQRAADGLTARQIAEQGIVLLQNTGSLLPLSTSTRRIALIGPMAGAAKTGGGGSSAVVPLYTVSPQAGIQNLDPSATITFDSGSNTASAAAAARGADVAIVEVGVNFSEGSDASISLGSQDALVSAVAAANPNTVVVVKSGSIALMPWASQVKGILEAFYPGEEDGNAVADVLFGAVNPSGRLPITVPGSDHSQVIAPGASTTVTYSEGLDMGYRAYDAHNVTPAFPFGFGLSYTTFGYSGLTVVPGAGNTATASFTVTNTGTRAGAEVAEVYVGFPSAAGEPPEQLKGFTKVNLAPGASQQVSIPLDSRAFSIWNTSTHGWTVTPGVYQIMVGSSSRDIRQSANLTVGGGGGGTSFSVAVAPNSQSVLQGGTATYTVSATATAGTPGPITLSANVPPPTGAAVTFGTNPISAGSSTTMTVTTATTSPVGSYAITVTGSDPTSTPPTATAGTTLIVNPPSGGLTLSNLVVHDAANAAHWSFQANFQVGNTINGDRVYTVASIPAALTGAQWVRTANSSKTSTANPLVSFVINQAATVYVGTDTRSGKRPWMDATWVDTHTVITTHEGTTTRTFEVFSKTFGAGTVALGPNATNTDMYTITVV